MHVELWLIYNFARSVAYLACSLSVSAAEGFLYLCSVHMGSWSLLPLWEARQIHHHQDQGVGAFSRVGETWSVIGFVSVHMDNSISVLVSYPSSHKEDPPQQMNCLALARIPAQEKCSTREILCYITIIIQERYKVNKSQNHMTGISHRPACHLQCSL